MNKEIFERRYRFLLLFSGLFNILFAAPLLLPHISNYYLSLLSLLNDMMRLGGASFTYPANDVHSLLINTAGIDLVLIGVVVLICSRRPLQNNRIILANAVGRTLFFFVILYYVIAGNLLRIVLLFGIIDIFISSLFLVCIIYSRRFTDSPDAQ
jgi:hypothetical protein